MNIVHTANLHLVNGENFITELPDFKGLVFKSEKIKDRFRRFKLRELYGKDLEQVPEDAKADILVITVQRPDGITSLPEGWQPDPVEPPKPVVKTIPKPIIYPEFISPAEFRWRRPQFKQRV